MITALILVAGLSAKTIYLKNEYGQNTIEVHVKKDPVDWSRGNTSYRLNKDFTFQNQFIRFTAPAESIIKVNDEQQSLVSLRAVENGVYFNRNQRIDICTHDRDMPNVTFYKDRLIVRTLRCMEQMFVQRNQCSYIEVKAPKGSYNEGVILHRNGTFWTTISTTDVEPSSYALVDNCREKIPFDSFWTYFNDRGNIEKLYIYRVRDQILLRTIDGNHRLFKATNDKHLIYFNPNTGLVRYGHLRTPEFIDLEDQTLVFDRYFEGKLVAEYRKYFRRRRKLKVIWSGPTKDSLNQCKKYVINPELREIEATLAPIDQKRFRVSRFMGSYETKKYYRGPRYVYDLYAERKVDTNNFHSEQRFVLLDYLSCEVQKTF